MKMSKIESATYQPLNFKLSPLVLALQAALVSGVALPYATAWGAETTRVSVSSGGGQSNEPGGSQDSVISADGRFVVFSSFASNLVAGDTNGTGDIFVRDRATNQTTRVSVNSSGVQGNDYSGRKMAISANGRYVAFVSKASNLVAGDTNGAEDVFVRDRWANLTTRVSVSSAGAQGTERSQDPAISADGRYVAFTSYASNLVAGDTNGSSDIFVRDRVANQTTRVSVNSGGGEGNYHSDSSAISADGRFVAFESEDNDVFVSDIFVRDRATKQTTKVSIFGSIGYWGSFSPAISADGRYVVFTSVLGGDVPIGNVFVYDRATYRRTRVSVGNGEWPISYDNSARAISADGRYVSFVTETYNWTTGDSTRDIFVRDLAVNQTTLVSVNSGGMPGNNFSNNPTISADGRYVAFQSYASNLVAGDTNGGTGPYSGSDVFVHDRLLNPNATANLTLTQTVFPNPVKVGANISFTATVVNQGPNNAGQVTLTDYPSLGGRLGLPPTLTTSQGSCYRGTTSICRLGTLLVGQQATVKMTFPAMAQGSVTNRVTANAAQKDLTPLNNLAITGATINP
jgi:uncharacterized repeat protein (TIGR01451 family)